MLMLLIEINYSDYCKLLDGAVMLFAGRWMKYMHLQGMAR